MNKVEHLIICLKAICISFSSKCECALHIFLLFGWSFFLSLPRTPHTREISSISIIWLVNFFPACCSALWLCLWWFLSVFVFIFYILKFTNLFFLSSGCQVIESPLALQAHRGILPQETIWRLLCFCFFMVKPLIYWEFILGWGMRCGSILVS